MRAGFPRKRCYDKKNAQVTVARGPVPRVLVFPRSFRTLISIEYAMCQVLKVCRTLMFLTAVRLLSIKDLRVLSFFLSAFSIDMQVLKDLKRKVLVVAQLQLPVLRPPIKTPRLP